MRSFGYYILSLLTSVLVVVSIVVLLSKGSIVKNILTFDLGLSLIYGKSNLAIAYRAACFSLDLAFRVVLLTLTFGLILGFCSFYYKNLEYCIDILSSVFRSIPSFILAGLMQLFFANYLRILPTARYNNFYGTIMPTLSLSITPIFIVAKIFKSSLTESYNSKYVILAKMKGLTFKEIFFRHMLRNSLSSVVAYIGRLGSYLVTGTLFIERIFLIPGLGSRFIEALEMNDFTLLFTISIIYSFVSVSSIYLSKFVNGFLDPRSREEI
tara:strand:- start:13112 stop:13915 length:804 start_codon:yes stop_codon:yes gene_type:complete